MELFLTPHEVSLQEANITIINSSNNIFSIKLKINLVEQNLVNLIHIIVKSRLNNFLVDTDKLELHGIVLF